MSSLKAGLELKRLEKSKMFETHTLERSNPIAVNESSISRFTTKIESPFNTNQSDTFNSEQSIQLLFKMFDLGVLVYPDTYNGHRVSEVNIEVES